MPVTAKLSRQFYERFGDKLTNELVDWFNKVDATYRADLRELNELNFGRFDAKLEQRFAQADAKLEQRFAQSDAKVEQRLAQMDRCFVELEARLGARLESGLSALRADLVKWMFIFWTGTTVTLFGAMIALLKL